MWKMAVVGQNVVDAVGKENSPRTGGSQLLADKEW